MTERDTDGLSDLAEVYKALGNEARLAVLLQLEEGESVSPLTDELKMTRSGLQKNIERLIDAGLVYRPVDSEQTYSLTQLGEFFVEEVHDEKQHVDQVLDDFRTRLEELREEEQETLDRMEDAGVDTKELETKLRAEAWDEIEKHSHPASEDNIHDSCVICGSQVELGRSGDRCETCGSAIHYECLKSNMPDVEISQDNPSISECPKCTG